MKLTKEHAHKIQSLIRYGIPLGKGVPKPGKMCIEHIVCHVIGRDHSDQPTECVLSTGISFKIALNDKNWGSDKLRAKGMERIGLAQLSSNGLSNQDFSKELQRLTIRCIVPIALRAIKLENMAILLEKEPTIENCLKAKKDAFYTAADAFYTAAYTAADAAADAADAADAQFKVLWICAELGVLAFRKIKSPGIEWMDELSPMTEEFKELIKDMPILKEELGLV